jgi:hypothetical protein
MCIDDRVKIITAMERDDVLWITFNGLQYDIPMLLYLLDNPECSTHDLKEFSDRIIGREKNPYRYDKRNYKQVDVLEVIRKGCNGTSLKALGVLLKHPKIQDLPIKPEQDITPQEYELMVEYNRNDLKITNLVYHKILDLVEMRQFLSEHYRIDLGTDGDSEITKKLFNKFYIEKLKEKYDHDKNEVFSYRHGRSYREDIAIKDLVYLEIYFQTEKMNDFFDKIYNTTIEKKIDKDGKGSYSFKFKGEFDGNVYVIGKGGIHTEDKPLMLTKDDNLLIVDLDVSSMYPSAIIYNKICPAHLDTECFVSIIETLRDDKSRYKKLWQDTGSKEYENLHDCQKIVANTAYGLFLFENYFLYDPVASFTCTINNQLYMLMLVEQFYLNDIKTISSNTDGVTVILRPDQLDLMRNVYKQWEELSGFVLEEVHYKKYIRRDVNNYIAIVDKSVVKNSNNEYIDVYPNKRKIKLKGDFVLQEKKDLLKGFEYPVVAKALVDYFVDNIPIIDTIYNHRDIYDFCFSQKCGSQYKNYLQKITRKYKLYHGKNLEKTYATPRLEDKVIEEHEQQKTLRFFVSIPESTPTPIDETLSGYAEYTHTGYSLKKKKLTEKNRYEVRPDPNVKKTYYIVDLGDNDQIVAQFSMRKSADQAVKEFNIDADKIPTIQTQDYVAGKFVTLFNDFFHVDNFDDYRIDYDFYIELVQKEIDKILGD